MAKKQNKPTKTCADCIHESACRGWTGGRYISDDSASRCPNHETVKESGAYLCGVLDERKRKITNADRIRNMSDKELATFMNCNGCPPKNEGCNDGQKCSLCWLEWLQMPAGEADNETD